MNNTRKLVNMENRKFKEQVVVVILVFVGFAALLLSSTIFMSIKSNRDLTDVLEQSIEAQLISTSIAARGLIDVEQFISLNSTEDVMADEAAYNETLAALRELKDEVGAEYIYALKYIDGVYRFVFDTDEESETLFDEYEIYDVHTRAFQGYEAAGIMNVVDEWGSFNTGAVPILHNGNVVGIISTDILDTFIQSSRVTATRNEITQVLVIGAMIIAMGIILFFLIKRVGKLQNDLFSLANIDNLTGLPNRHYLMSHLPEVVDKAKKHNTSFALLLVDVDNFKAVNDNAGHDAGDELLQQIANYLESVTYRSESFRPSAGALNVSARIGGDEFVQILHGVRNVDEAHIIGKKVIGNFVSTPGIEKFVEKYGVGLSVGIALFPHDTTNFNVLIKYADLAMYRAKKEGKSDYRVYDASMSKEI